MTAEEYKEKYQKIKRLAFKKNVEELPSAKEGTYTTADRMLFLRVRNIVLRYNAGELMQTEAAKKADAYENMYMHEKSVEENNAKSDSEILEKRIKSSQTVAELTKQSDVLSDRELLEKCIDVIGCFFSDVTANEIRKQLVKRGEETAVILSNTSEGKIREVLLCIGIDHKVINELFSTADKIEPSEYNGFKVVNEGKRKYSLYKSPEVIKCLTVQF